MKTKILLQALAVCTMFLSACQPSQPAAPATAVVEQLTNTPQPTTPAPTNTPSLTAAPSLTATPASTNTALPTETTKPTNTPLPAGLLFRDDFTGELQPGWEWQNENPAKWTFTDDGWLQIIGENNSLLGEKNQNNLLWYSLPAGDFVITAHLKTKPFENFHQATIYIYEDPDNYVAINRGYCDICPPGGGGFFMEYKISGLFGAYSAIAVAEDVYLRLENSNNSISGYYATEPDNWVRLGRFGNFFQFKKVGIGVSNVNAPNDLVGLFDYFEISQP